MIRRIVVGLLSVTFLLAGLAIAQDPAGGDDPPVRLKKKPQPDAAEPPKEEQPKPAEPPKEQPKEKDPKAKEPKEGEEPDQPEKPEMDEAEVLNRVGKNMRTSEDRIDRAELNDATHQVQEDILKDLDSLINQEKNGGGGGGDNQDQQNQDQQNQDNKGSKQNQGGQVKIGMGKPKGGLKGGRQQQAKKGQGQKPGGQQVAKGGDKPNNQGGGQQGQKPPQPDQQHGNLGGGGGQSVGESTKLAEIYKDVWGHLPETMRAEMNAYSREQFMAKYNDLIKQYYSTVAEKSRKKD